MDLILLCEIVVRNLLKSAYPWVFYVSWLDRIHSIYNEF